MIDDDKRINAQLKTTYEISDKSSIQLVGLIEDRADITLAEMVERLDADHAVRVQLSTLWSVLRKRGLTYKKRPRTRASRAAKTSSSAG